MPDKILFAGIIGLGCAIGSAKMAQISTSVGAAEFDSVINWRFSLENLLAANDRITGFMAAMELPNIYRRAENELHTASDGQKFEVRADSLNANYSFKYFGKGQGVSAYTFIDERNLFWYSLVFSAAERESAYVIDGLMRNDVVKSDIHSTDTHGFSEAIFAVTHLLGCTYAPRIKNLKKQSLYMFRSQRGADRTGWTIKPDKYVDRDLITASWDDVLRLVATIKLKESTASDIFRRLNSYSRQHGLYTTLKALGRIVKSTFILRYLDDVELRMAIEKQLNRIELGNRFTRAVAVSNQREFTPGIRRSRRSQRPATASSRTPSSAGTTCCLSTASARHPATRPRRRSARLSPITRSSHGPTSTYWASTTSPTKSSAIPLEFHLPKIASEITPRNGTSKNGF